jgi:hypothetical protein
MKLFTRSAILAVTMSLCVWLALFGPPVWKGIFANDAVGRGTTMGLLMFLLAVMFRGGLGWSMLELLLSLVWAPFLAISATSYLSGMTWQQILGGFNSKGLVTLGVSIAAPWLVGLLVASRASRGKKQQSQKPA